MTITDEDCLTETLAFNEQFEATAALRPPRGRTLDPATLEHAGAAARPVRPAARLDRRGRGPAGGAGSAGGAGVVGAPPAVKVAQPAAVALAAGAPKRAR
ncbi:hypothetical protein ABZX88_17730 [Kitasatospora aureofaciens]|uniref:hypothetical protein n=1 Tax=Kitasatospora aureofaciens TaxID=1894 RepID=UPI0033B9F7FD